MTPDELISAYTRAMSITTDKDVQSFYEEGLQCVLTLNARAGKAETTINHIAKILIEYEASALMVRDIGRILTTYYGEKK